MTPADRQKRYRERQRAKLVQVATAPSIDRLDLRIQELDAENDRLAVKVDQLQRALKAKENEITRLSKALDAKHADLEHLRSRVARWKTDAGAETTQEPPRTKTRRKKA